MPNRSAANGLVSTARSLDSTGPHATAAVAGMSVSKASQNAPSPSGSPARAGTEPAVGQQPGHVRQRGAPVVGGEGSAPRPPVRPVESMQDAAHVLGYQLRRTDGGVEHVQRGRRIGFVRVDQHQPPARHRGEAGEIAAAGRTVQSPTAVVGTTGR